MLCLRAGSSERVRENCSCDFLHKGTSGLPEIDAKKSIIGVHGFPCVLS